jgi:hypothetical protein
MTFLGPCSKLQKATGVARRHDLGFDLRKTLHLGFQDLARHFGLKQAVGPCSATTGLCIGMSNQFESRNRFKQPSRRRGDPLTVYKMAGIVVGHAEGKPTERFSNADFV